MKFIEVSPLNNPQEPEIINLSHVIKVTRHRHKNTVYAVFRFLDRSYLISDMHYHYARAHLLPADVDPDNYDQEDDV